MRALILLTASLLFAGCQTSGQQGENSSMIAAFSTHQAIATGSMNSFMDEVFQRRTQNENGPDAFVRTIFEDSKGNLWIGTWNYLFMYDGRYFINMSQRYGLGLEPVFAITEDRDGVIWLGTWRRGLVKFENSKFTSYSIKQGLASNYVHSLLNDNEGRLWVGTDAGIQYYNDDRLISVKSNISESAQSVYAIIQESNGRMLAGTSAGVYSFSTAAAERVSGTEAMNDVRNLSPDSNGAIWISHAAGVSILHKNTITNLPQSAGSVKGKAWCSSVDDKGNRWIGMYDERGSGLGISVWNGSTAELITEKNDLLSDRVFCMFHDSKNNFWIGTADGLCRWDGTRFINYIDLNEGC